MTQQKPSLGRIVHVLVSPSINNGSDIAPAIVTRVFGDSCVNVRVLLDNTPGRADEWATSRILHADEATARAENNKSLPSGVGAHAFWPSRV